jgi:hypothetical protein
MQLTCFICLSSCIDDSRIFDISMLRSSSFTNIKVDEIVVECRAECFTKLLVVVFFQISVQNTERMKKRSQ